MTLREKLIFHLTNLTLTIMSDSVSDPTNMSTSTTSTSSNTGTEDLSNLLEQELDRLNKVKKVKKGSLKKASSTLKKNSVLRLPSSLANRVKQQVINGTVKFCSLPCTTVSVSPNTINHVSVDLLMKVKETSQPDVLVDAYHGVYASYVPYVVLKRYEAKVMTGMTLMSASDFEQVRLQLLEQSYNSAP